MKLLLDTQVLLWAAGVPERLSSAARKLLDDTRHQLLFSAASLWEVAIKNGLGRPDFHAEPGALRRGLFDNGYQELPITGEHAVTVGALPPLHKWPRIRRTSRRFRPPVTCFTVRTRRWLGQTSPPRRTCLRKM